MSDEVETMMYAKSGGVPWHGKGVALEGVPDSKTAYRESGLNWTVATGPVHDHLNRPIPGRVTIYRESDDAVLGLATDIWSPIQNKVMFDIGDAFFRDGRAGWEAAGSLRGGKEVWALLQLPHEITVNGKSGDRHASYFMLRSGHDGNTGFSGWLTRVRAICANTVAEAMQGDAAFKVEHYGNTTERLVKAAQAIRITTEADRRYSEWLNMLAATPVEASDVNKLGEALFPDCAPDGDAPAARKNQKQHWLDILHEEEDKFGRHQYSVFNSLTGFGDHGVSVRKRPDGDERMIASFDGVVADWKKKSLRTWVKIMGVTPMPTMAGVGAG